MSGIASHDGQLVMTDTPDSTLVVFPGAVGDFICFLPALLALRAVHGPRLTLVARPEVLDLVGLSLLTKVSIDRPEIADLFHDSAPLQPRTRELLGGHGAAYSWSGASEPSVARRLEALTAGPVRVLPFRGMRPGEHAVDYYARSAGVEPCQPISTALSIDRDWLAGFAACNDLDGKRVLVVHPGSGSPRKNWTGFGDLVRLWLRRTGDGGHVVVLRGPAERGQPGFEAAHSITVADGLRLPQVAALVERCDAYAGNDSGISHLAGAAGARGAVLFYRSDPVVWAPRAPGLVALRAEPTCTRCAADLFCTHRLRVERVLDCL